MQALQRFEEFVERLMEGSFARLFRSPIQPAEIAKRLEREMEAHPTISVGRTYVPNVYEVTLNPEDFAEFEPFRHSLEHNMAEFVSDLASERGYSLVSRPRVTLQAGEGTPRRGIEIDSQLSDQPAASTITSSAGAPTARRSGGEEPQITRTHAMPQITRNRPQAGVAGSRPVAAPPLAYLQPQTGDMVGRDFPVSKTLVSMGRGLDNDLVVDDPRVSRHHAQITFRHSHYLLRDLRSTNGTFVNNQPVEAVVLASGDIVSLGGFELTFVQE
ncbi:MAG: FHA domain-containing protein [Chloroflexi bacterium]|nr:FHA domain-containing protein [Chloroflexota bacterium]